MKRTKYTAEFKLEAVKQILEKGHSATEVASRLGVPVGLLYTWSWKLKGPDEQPIEDVKALQAEMAKLKAELRRTTEERDILKKAAAYFAKVSEWSTRLSKSIEMSLGSVVCAGFWRCIAVAITLG